MAELTAGLGVLNAFVKAGLVKSNGEARRQIAGGGLRVNDAAVADEKATLTPKDVIGRRDQAVARQEAARAVEAGVGRNRRDLAMRIADRRSWSHGSATCHCGGTRIELPRLPEPAGVQLHLLRQDRAVWGHFGAAELQVVGRARPGHTKQRGDDHHAAVAARKPGATADGRKSTTSMARPRTACRCDMPTCRSYAIRPEAIGRLRPVRPTAEKVDGRNNW